VFDADSQAVYRCFSEGGQLLYVGTTGNLGRRLAEHAQKIWFLEVRGITLEWFPDEVRALAAERRAIFVERPKYNLAHKNAPLRAVPLPVRRPLAPPRPSAPKPPVTDRFGLFAQALINAAETGITPKRLLEESGLCKTLVYELLTALVQLGAVVHPGRGYYRPVPGQDVARATAVYCQQRRPSERAS
jgi:predicted GIY-YIG superfamily endonuclease